MPEEETTTDHSPEAGAVGGGGEAGFIEANQMGGINAMGVHMATETVLGRTQAQVG